MLDEEERNILTYIKTKRPELTELFTAHVTAGRRGILHRFLQAMIRENIAGIAARVKAEDNRIKVHFADGSLLAAPVGRWHSLGRFDLGEGPVMLTTAEGSREIAHAAELLDLLRGEGIVNDEAGEHRFRRFRQELQNSTANLALALAGAEWRRRTLQAETESSTSLAYAQQQMQQEERFSPLAFYEQWVVEGHPLHPGAKIKMGLDVADVILHSPEWGAQPAVVPVAVRKVARRCSSLVDKLPAEILCAEYPGLEAHVASRLQELGLNPQDYDLIPVHPWQYEHTLPVMFAAAIARREVVPIPSYRLHTAALMSFRSLAPHQKRCEGRHHIKTAVNVQTTGAVRTVAPSAAVNGPIISRLLREIQVREGHFDGKFVILEERAGIHYLPTEEGLSDEDRLVLGKNLAALLRENPENHVQETEIAMPGSALLAQSPLSDKPVAGELIEQWAQTQGIGDLHTAAVSFIQQYAETSLPGFLTTMSRYGISLEGHLQNSVAVFRNGGLVRMILRDFGGVRVLRERIAKQGLSAEFYPGAATIIDDVQDMRNKIYYPVFQNHFGELIAAIVRWSGIDEHRLWAPVIKVCRDVFAMLQQDAEIAEQTASDAAALFEQTIDLKAMATMRLLGDVTTYTFAKVPNPLALTEN